MMKQLIVFTTVLIGLLIAPSWAQSAKEGEVKGLKVGVVDFQRAINETKEGQKADRTFQKEVEERKKKFEILKSELETMRLDLEKNRLVLDGKVLEERKQALQQKLMEVEKTGFNYEQELSQKKGEALQKILAGLQQIVQEIGKKEAYDFIFEKSQGGVLYTMSAIDLTARVIQEYDKIPQKP